MVNHTLDVLGPEALKEAFVGGLVGGTLATVGIVLAILLTAAFYVYHAMAWQKIAKRMKFKKSWLAWIPIANIAMILKLGKFHWAWVFLILIPILGWIALFVLVVISNWRIFGASGWPPWFSLSLIIPEIGGVLYLVALGFVAWSKPSKKK